ncbi:GAP family protein [Klebsiella pneumoniae]
MSAGLFAILSGLALVDALNPFTVAAQAYLLGTARPMPRSIAFLLGTFATYFAGGVLLLEGWSLLLARVLPLVPSWGIPAGEVVLGLLVGGFAAWSFAKASAGAPFTPPSDLSIGATLTFAFGSTVADLSSALPYFGAVNQIAAMQAGLPIRFLALSWYNLLYCVPLIALIAARAILSPDASEALFGRMRRGIDWAFAKLLPPIMALASLALIGDGLRRLLAAV